MSQPTSVMDVVYRLLGVAAEGQKKYVTKKAVLETLIARGIAASPDALDLLNDVIATDRPMGRRPYVKSVGQDAPKPGTPEQEEVARRMKEWSDSFK